ncbi:AraC family invasion system transcriptional regulator VirF, partial [Shigella flexneri]|nr:AraC family invasion system transcriptional regulator VirF [Shigella flexneri]EFZ4835467.1 AraC family invasion system transcriptional regulator VirF [Shigella sonnei]EFU1030915.1 AraC family invasion system transcriptional regulator VirF [Shigella flexneri]EFW6628452.1 AraC family invasion system transcriptional regulator VirF [Shigella flexneri]EHM5377864.1 AraC family invasion system transcriptional regulator VirF [Shigella flexneri]
VRLHNYIILYAKRCSMTVSSGNETLTIDEGQIAFIERNIQINVSIKKSDSINPFEIISLDRNLLLSIIRIMEPIYSFQHSYSEEKRGLNKKIFLLSEEEVSIDLFKSIKEMPFGKRKIYSLACLLSAVSDEEALYTSISIASSLSFSDQIRKIVEKNIEKRWRLSDISNNLNLSEIAVRKRLESEKLTFQQILLDIRMHHAAKLLLNSQSYINDVSRLIGISSPSYFIRKFNEYYGITPKKFYLYHKKF